MADEEYKQTGNDAPDEVTDQGEGQPEDVESLKSALAEAQAKAEENWNQFLRARAEVENVRRRAERDVEQARRHTLEKFAGEMLAVKDSLEMGVEAARDENADVAKLREGSELTLKMLNQAMEKFHIQAIEPQGERFDPERHEAMAAQPSEEHEPNTVIHVVQKGYQVGERLIRPAMVIVSKAGESGQSGGIDEQA